MDFFGLAIRAAVSEGGDVFSPYSFVGLWTDEEIQRVEAILKPNVPEKVDSMFPNWRFTKGVGGFIARRATWEDGWCETTLDPIIEKLSAYYGEPGRGTKQQED